MDEKIMEMFAQLLQGQTGTNSKIENLSQKIESLEENQLRLEKNQLRMENSLNPRIQVLFDGYKQHTDILERIEKEVTKQDEIIMRRVFK